MKRRSFLQALTAALSLTMVSCRLKSATTDMTPKNIHGEPISCHIWYDWICAEPGSDARGTDFYYASTHEANDLASALTMSGMLLVNGEFRFNHQIVWYSHAHMEAIHGN